MRNGGDSRFSRRLSGSPPASRAPRPWLDCIRRRQLCPTLLRRRCSLTDGLTRHSAPHLQEQLHCHGDCAMLRFLCLLTVALATRGSHSENDSFSAKRTDPRRMWAVLLVPVGAAVALSACGGGGTPTASPTTSSTSAKASASNGSSSADTYPFSRTTPHFQTSCDWPDRSI